MTEFTTILFTIVIILFRQRRDRFYTQGAAAQAEIAALNQQIRVLKTEIGVNFPLEGQPLKQFIEHLRDQIQVVQDVERQAVDALQAAMGDDKEETLIIARLY